MPLTSLVTDQLAAVGLPMRYTSQISTLFQGDIVRLGVRLALIGLLASLIRGHYDRLKNWANLKLFPTAHLTGSGREWMSSFISQSPELQRQLTHYRVVAREESEGRGKKPAKRDTRMRTWSEDGVSALILPNNYFQLRITFNGRWLWLTRHTSFYGGDHRSTDAHYRVNTWFWNEGLIKEFILQAYKVHHEKSESELHIYNHSTHKANWEGPFSRPARPWSSLILDKKVKDGLLRDVRDFISEEEKSWYTSKGIPHRRGYLLHGPPGSGKTTLATALASTLRLDLYCINPAAIGMDNSKLQKCFRNCPPGSMILMEDIDCVMPTNRAKQNGSSSDGDDGGSDSTSTAPAGSKDLGPSTVTLSGLLNAIDGVSSQEDSVLFASTNYPDKLDAALRRPGRFDVHIAFHHAVHQQAADLFKHFYPLSRISHDSHDTREKIHEKSTSHPFKDQADLDQAADQFADRVLSKNVKVSIATIQGFLLLYKKDPERALDEVEEWAEGIRLEQFPKAGEKEEIIVEAQIEVVEKQDEGVKMNGEDAEKQAMKPKGRSQKMRFQEEEKEIVLA